MRKFFYLLLAAVTVTLAACGDGNNPDQPEQLTPGALKGKFSVAPGKQVYFSQGNLQATTENKGESWTWSFATNQWDFVGNQVANNAISGNSKVSTNGTVDLFVWSCYKNYYGIHNSQDKYDYNGPCEDWGNNPISNGGNEPKLWRTLTNDEWVYLFQTREDAANKYGAAKVNDIPGYVFLPDEWTLPSGLQFTPGKTAQTTQGDWSKVASTNIYDINQWDAMEKKGAVFLPTAGSRQNGKVGPAGTHGFYWTATHSPTSLMSDYLFYFIADYFSLDTADPCTWGCSVRLVQDIN